MKPSLQMRLVVGVVSGVLSLLVVFSVGIYTVIRSALLSQFDASLTSIAQMLAAAVELDGDQIELDLEVQQMPEFQDRDRPTYYQLWRPDGTVAAKSHPTGRGGDLPRLSGSINKPAFRTIKRRPGQVERAVGFSFVPRLSDAPASAAAGKTVEPQPLTLAVARDSTAILSQLRFLRGVLFIASGAVALLSILVAVLTVRQGLRPLAAIAGQIAAIREDDLAARIRATSVPAEILPVKNRLNDLLSRLEDAFRREKRFTADVAHELRTPLAGIRSTIEVTLTRTRQTSEYQAVLSECLAIVESMQTMVNNLLMIARLDAGAWHGHLGRDLMGWKPMPREQIHLAQLVSSCWRPFSEKAGQRRITFENRIPDDVTLKSDRESFSMVLSNLFDNAVEYTNDSGQIWVTAQRYDDSVQLTVANTGCQLTNDQVGRAFECFWRGDSSRAGTGTHCGLGLALVQRLVRALGGSAAAEVQPGGVFIISLTLPVSAC